MSNPPQNPILLDTLNEIKEQLNKSNHTLNIVNDNTNKSTAQKSKELVEKYFNSDHAYGGVYMFGILITSLCYTIPMYFINISIWAIIMILKIMLFLMIFLPIMIIGIVFMILIFVMIKVWMLGKTFLEALIPAVNSIIPIPITLWNLIASIFNAIGSLARKFGGRMPRMPTIKSSYRIKHKIASIFEIIDLVIYPLKELAFRTAEEGLNKTLND